MLAKAGIVGMNVGVNDASAPPDVPSIRACLAGEIAVPFIWRDEASGTEVLAAFHPGGCTSDRKRHPMPFARPGAEPLNPPGLVSCPRVLYAWGQTE